MDKSTTTELPTEKVRNRIADRAVVLRHMTDVRDRIFTALEVAMDHNASHAITEEIRKARASITLALQIANNELDAEWSNLTTV